MNIRNSNQRDYYSSPEKRPPNRKNKGTKSLYNPDINETN
jgi:hypothetical protein